MKLNARRFFKILLLQLTDFRTYLENWRDVLPLLNFYSPLIDTGPRDSMFQMAVLEVEEHWRLMNRMMMSWMVLKLQ